VQKEAPPGAPKPEAKRDASPSEPKPSPGIDAKAALDGKAEPKESKVANASGETSEVKEPIARQEEPAKNTPPAGAKPDVITPDPPPHSAPKPMPEKQAKPRAKSQTSADRSEPGGASRPLLPILALAGVGFAYAAGQHLRGRTKGGVKEQQIIAGGALAVLAAIAVKLLDLLGADVTVTAALAGLIALGAALLA
jgi:hypothetical protein